MNNPFSFLATVICGVSVLAAIACIVLFFVKSPRVQAMLCVGIGWFLVIGSMALVVVAMWLTTFVNPLSQLYAVASLYMIVGWMVPCVIGGVVVVNSPIIPASPAYVPSCGIPEIDAEIQPFLDAYDRQVNG